VDIDHDETFFSPSCTPLVLDEDVLVTVGSKFTPTYGKNTVIDLSTATLRKDTSFVLLESSGAGGNTDRDWTESKGGFKWMDAQLSVLMFLNLNVFVRGDGTGSFSSIV